MLSLAHKHQHAKKSSQQTDLLVLVWVFLWNKTHELTSRDETIFQF